MDDKWDLERKICIRALKDQTFKQELITNPKKALKGFFQAEGIAFTNLDKLSINVQEDKKNEWNLHLLSLPTLKENVPLSEKDLQDLSGGGLFGDWQGFDN
jgi:hypothetical protein